MRRQTLLIAAAALIAAGAAADDAQPRMKALVYHTYGDIDVLRIEEIDRPAINDDQVLIKVHAASVNPLDWHTMRGAPYIMRLDAGLREPKDIQLGADVAGEVVAVGRNASEFKPGDEVFGTGGGTLAEYVRSSKNKIVAKPAEISFEQAAAVPVAALTALQGVRDHGHIHAGQKVLINGASGGVGTFAVQIAKAFGAEVTGVCSTRNLQMVSGIGADHVIDYTKADFTAGSERYDVIVDAVGNQSLSAIRRVLKPDGTYVLIGGGGPEESNGLLGPLAGMLKLMVMKPFVSQHLEMFIAAINHDDLATLAKMMKEKTVTPVIDRTYPLSEAPSAIGYLEQGHARGKVIVVVTPPAEAPAT